MRKIISSVSSSAIVFVLPLLAAATTNSSGNTADFDSKGGLGSFLASILEFINGVLIPFIIGIGFLLFVWGMFQYFIAGGANDEKKEQGKSLMIWATIGFVLIIIFWGIINVLAGSTGLDQDFDDDLIPSAPTLDTN